jgi:outer membrane immunogenic protein
MRKLLAVAMLVAAPISAQAAENDWTGFYIGANVGALGLSSKSSYTDHAGYESSGQGGGALAGGTIGYDMQFSALVVGVEADYAVSNAGNTGTGEHGYTYNIPLATAKVTSFGSLRARIGYAFDHTLLYATGGWAWAHIHNDAVDEYINDPDYFASTTRSQSGYVIGLGIEQALGDHIAIKLEGLYADFSGVHAADNYYELSFKNSAEIAQIGIVYRF